MAMGIAITAPSFAHADPSLQVRGEPETNLEYTIRARIECIDGRKQQIFDRIFEDHAREWDAIADGAAAELIQLSNLADDVLAEVWESALIAKYLSASETSVTRQGYLSKDEFFVLLSELQLRLDLSDDDFSNRFSDTPLASRPRRNPFSRNSIIGLTTPAQSPAGAPPIPPKIVEKENGHLSRRSSIGIQEIEGSVVEATKSRKENVTNEYAEHGRSFRFPTLALPLKSTISCDFLLSIQPPASSAHVEALRSSDKEVVPDQWTPTLPKILDEEFDETARNSNPVISNLTISRDEETADRTYVELDASPTPQSRWGPDDFGDRLSSRSVNESSTTQSRSMSAESAVVLSRPQLEYVPLSTAFSDRLAVQRITSLGTSESPLQRKSSLRNIGTAMNIVRKKTINVKSKPIAPDLDKAPSGYSYAKLAEALQDAVAEGNLSLVVSLFNLGANVNYSSIKHQTRHNILQLAVALGNLDVVEYFISLGADGISVDSALTTAFFADHVDLAIKLIPHANAYHLQHYESPGPEYQKLSASSLGRIIRDRTMPAASRLRLLSCFFGQKYFDANRIVVQAYDTANSRPFQLSSLATLVAQLDVEGAQMIVPSLSTVKRHSVRNALTNHVHHMGAICCIRPSHWRLSPARAYVMLQLLIEDSADVGEIAHWPGQGAMSPLACAVSGGSFEGSSLLIALDADPECAVHQLQSNGKEAEAYSALGWAAFKGRLDICTLLIDAGATPWRTSFKGYTPLYLACRGGYIDVVGYLLSLDVERSMVDTCLVAAVKGDEPRIVEILLTVGASITPETWIAVMMQPRKPCQRSNLLTIVDLMLLHDSVIYEEPVLAAIDSDNFAGLSRILERRNGELDFDKNAAFGNWRWSPANGAQDCRDRTCLNHAAQRGKQDFVALLRSYGWRNEIAEWRSSQAQLF